jgi:hypothetical protein
MGAAANTLSITDLEKVWFDAEALRPIHEINAAVIQALVDGARTLQTNPLVTGDPVVRELRELSGESISRLASVPVCWLDAGFGLAERWSAVTTEHLPADVTPRTVLDFLLSRSDCERLAPLVMDAVSQLAQRSPPSGRVVFGVQRQAIHAIASLSRTLIQQIGRNRPQWMRVRWGTRPDRWLDVIEIARAEPDVRLPPVAARTLLHQFADLEGCNMRSVQNTSLPLLER